MGGKHLNAPMVGMLSLGFEYYTVASDGGIFAFGPTAYFYGSMGGQPLNKPVVGMADGIGVIRRRLLRGGVGRGRICVFKTVPRLPRVPHSQSTHRRDDLLLGPWCRG